ncbi:hypothetical protein SSABA_v1c00280 [Spiroplasma sabaudiense Ar-1343]|uniref:Uncharacterized protein n=1 Tax=Spiroplasma sabaudiense Ar-1343 TaxID=1276257 RepID=W6A974_9MOLU|nr:hypothetical protein [Spiroplasma sabaudiense]AHI53440.1 hypothetical protein SSABA_v1c00280 [Spiroplasma sabaudiense Ar-1343]
MRKLQIRQFNNLFQVYDVTAGKVIALFPSETSARNFIINEIEDQNLALNQGPSGIGGMPPMGHNFMPPPMMPVYPPMQPVQNDPNGSINMISGLGNMMNTMISGFGSLMSTMSTISKNSNDRYIIEPRHYEDRYPRYREDFYEPRDRFDNQYRRSAEMDYYNYPREEYRPRREQYKNGAPNDNKFEDSRYRNQEFNNWQHNDSLPQQDPIVNQNKVNNPGPQNPFHYDQNQANYEQVDPTSNTLDMNRYDEEYATNYENTSYENTSYFDDSQQNNYFQHNDPINPSAEKARLRNKYHNNKNSYVQDDVYKISENTLNNDTEFNDYTSTFNFDINKFTSTEGAFIKKNGKKAKLANISDKSLGETSAYENLESLSAATMRAITNEDLIKVDYTKTIENDAFGRNLKKALSTPIIIEPTIEIGSTIENVNGALEYELSRNIQKNEALENNETVDNTQMLVPNDLLAHQDTVLDLGPEEETQDIDPEPEDADSSDDEKELDDKALAKKTKKDQAAAEKAEKKRLKLEKKWK